MNFDLATPTFFRAIGLVAGVILGLLMIALAASQRIVFAIICLSGCIACFRFFFSGDTKPAGQIRQPNSPNQNTVLKLIALFVGLALLAYAIPDATPFVGMFSILTTAIAIVGLTAQRFRRLSGVVGLASLFLFVICVALSPSRDGKAGNDAKAAGSDIPLAVSHTRSGALEEAFQKRLKCERGDGAACRELCSENLNGNTQNYKCASPRPSAATNTDHIGTTKLVVADAVACTDLRDEQYAVLLDIREDDDAVKRWIATERKPCTLLDGPFDVTLLGISPDGYWKHVAIERDGRKLWVTAPAVVETPGHGK